MKNTFLNTIVGLALAEDLGSGDITTNSLIPKLARAKACIILKSAGVVCGLSTAEVVFKTLNKNIKFQCKVFEGVRVKKGTVVAVVEGSARAILSGERVALNLLAHLSAVATSTRAFVDAIKPYKTKIMDTRKTTPLLRHLERYAVRTGGGVNHRFDLSQMVMIKDNHRHMASLSDAVKTIKSKTNKTIEVEVDTLDQFKEALNSKADIILLDNMTPAQVRQAVALRQQLNPRILLEASGNINIDNVRAYAAAGVERISIGSLTTAPSRIDISLDLS